MNKRDFLKTSFATAGLLLIPRKIWALDFFPTTKNVEWAILYGTWCGSARDASVWIAEGMDGIADVFDVRENPDLSKYKHIVIGGAIRSGVTPDALQQYLIKNKEVIKNKTRGLFAVCGNMKQLVTQEQYNRLINNHLAVLTESGNVPSKVFLGRITLGLMEPEVQKQMKAIPNMEDYDNLKRSECLDFGKEVLRSVLNK
jgi:menaquinone-dependent protoporphyrinogen IX oxidase